MFFPFHADAGKPEQAPPAWVEEMRERYRTTGEVRAEDMTRVLGDPSKGVYMRTEDQLPGGPSQHSLF